MQRQPSAHQHPQLQNPLQIGSRSHSFGLIDVLDRQQTQAQAQHQQQHPFSNDFSGLEDHDKSLLLLDQLPDQAAASISSAAGSSEKASAAAGSSVWHIPGPEPPVDWSLRTRIRLLSPLPLAWCGGLHRHAAPPPAQVGNLKNSSNSSTRGGNDGKNNCLDGGEGEGSDSDEETPQERLQAALMHWEAAFQHLWRLYCRRRIPYFYYCAPQLTVLFAHAPEPSVEHGSKHIDVHSSSDAGGGSGHDCVEDRELELWQGMQHMALVSGSGSRFRKLLQEAGVQVRLPFLPVLEQKLAAAMGGGSDPDDDEVWRELRPNGGNNRKRIKRQAGDRNSSRIDTGADGEGDGQAEDDDEAERSDLAARKRVQIRRLRQHLQLGDGADSNFNLTLASSLRLTGLTAVHGLYDCLLNEVQRLPTEDVPFLRSPAGFIHGSLATAQISRPRSLRRSHPAPGSGGPVSVPTAAASSEETASWLHSVEIFGVLLPCQVQRILRLALRQQECQLQDHLESAVGETSAEVAKNRSAMVLLEATLGSMAPTQNLNAAGESRLMLELPRRRSSAATAAACPPAIAERPEVRQLTNSMFAVSRKLGPSLTVARSSGISSGWLVKTAR